MPGRNRIEEFGQLAGAVIVGVFGQDAPPGCIAERSGPFLIQRFQVSHYLAAIVRHQHLLPRLQEEFDAFPGVGDETGACTGGFEDPCGRRKALADHAFAVDVEDSLGCAVKGIVIGCVDVSQVVHIG